MRSREPIFNMPGAVIGFIGLLVLIHVVLWYVDENDRLGIRAHLAFQPGRYMPTISRLPDWPWASVWSFVSHQLVHADATHLAMNSVWLLAFGGAVASRIGNLRFLLLGITSGVVGALFFLAFRWNDPAPMVGASGAVSGLMGGAFRFFYNLTDARGEGHDPPAAAVPRMSLLETFTDRRVLTMVVIWLVLNFATAAAEFLITTDGKSIAWQAHLGGFLFGILGFALFDRQRLTQTTTYPPSTPDPERPTLH